MGQGNTATENKVTKSRQVNIAGMEAGGGSKPDTSESCYFKIEDSVEVGGEIEVVVGDSAVVVPNLIAKQSDLYLGRYLVGKFVSAYARQVSGCMRKGFIYEGKILSVDAVSGGKKVGYYLVGKKKKV